MTAEKRRPNHWLDKPDYHKLSSLIVARNQGGELPPDDVATLRTIIAKIVPPELVDTALAQALRRMGPIPTGILLGTIRHTKLERVSP